MEQFEGLSVAETVSRVAALLGCSPTSAQVAAYLDDHDQLRHFREKFLVPKIADLPPCESFKNKYTYIYIYNKTIENNIGYCCNVTDHSLVVLQLKI